MTYEQNEPDFERWLKHALTQTNIKPSELAKIIEVDRTTVYSWLSGKKLINDTTSRIRIAKIISHKMDLDYRDVIIEILWTCHVSEYRRSL